MRLIFNIIEQFKCHCNAKYLAVHLFEKYVNFKMKQNFDTSPNSLNRNFIINQSEMKLRLLSCIQLASKMDSNEDYLKISHVRQINIFYSKNIYSSVSTEFQLK